MKKMKLIFSFVLLLVFYVFISGGKITADEIEKNYSNITANTYIGDGGVLVKSFEISLVDDE